MPLTAWRSLGMKSLHPCSTSVWKWVCGGRETGAPAALRPQPRSLPSTPLVVTVPRTDIKRGSVDSCVVGERVRPRGVERLHAWLGRMWRVNNCPRIWGFKAGIFALPLPAVAVLWQLLSWKTGAWRCFSGLLANILMLLSFESCGDAGAALLLQ